MIDNGINNSEYQLPFKGKVNPPFVRQIGNKLIVSRKRQPGLYTYYTINNGSKIRLRSNVITIEDDAVVHVFNVLKRDLHPAIYSRHVIKYINGLTPPPPPIEVDYLCFTAEEEGARLSIYGERTSDKTFDLPDFKYSTDKKNWTELTYTEGEEDKGGYIPFSSQIITLGLGEKVYFKGLNQGGVNHNDLEKGYGVICAFDISNGKIAASGDIGTLIDEVGGENVELDDYAFGGERGLFAMCTDLTQAPKLPALSLSTACYASLFLGCTSLSTAPILPATTLEPLCYAGMFDNCTFPMSNDGTTFNFDFGATLPQTVSEDTFTTHKDVADWMGNTTGFNE